MIRVNWGYNPQQLMDLKLEVMEVLDLTPDPFKDFENSGDPFIRRARSSKNKKELPFSNTLIWGDNIYVLNALQQALKEKIQLIYCDPPFYAGTNEYLDVPIKLKDGNQHSKFERSVISKFGYRNIWTNPEDITSFIRWIRERFRLMRDPIRNRRSCPWCSSRASFPAGSQPHLHPHADSEAPPARVRNHPRRKT